MKQHFGIERVHVDDVFRDYIRLTGTSWKSMNRLLRYLAETSKKVIVEETKTGWYITYIDGVEEITDHKPSIKSLENLK